jgi:hypothetical protein
LTALLPEGVEPASMAFRVQAYAASSPYFTLRVYDVFAGPVTSEAFCLCLGGTWGSNSCMFGPL